MTRIMLIYCYYKGIIIINLIIFNVKNNNL